MIEQATERRLAGDWRGACAAAGVDVTFDLGKLADDHGAEFAAVIENDLLNFAPDLLRWHLPRELHGHTTLRAGGTALLASYDRDESPRLPGDSAGERWRIGGRWLHVVPPRTTHAPQRLRLKFGQVHAGQFWCENWSRARHLWDASRSHELLERSGGSTRAPFFHTDGTPLTKTELPTGPSRNPAEHTEWVVSLHERGEIEAVFAATGIELGVPSPQASQANDRLVPIPLARIPLALTRLADEVRLTGHDKVTILHGPLVMQAETNGTEVRVRLVRWGQDLEAPVLAEACWRRLPDLDLLRAGLIDPQSLHPMVHAALFPAATTPALGPPETVDHATVRVRCRDNEWHEIGSDLSMPHDNAERERERVMKAFGRERERAMKPFGRAITGCFAVEDAWMSGKGWLPKALRERRRDLFTRAQHGDTPGVLRLLDAGLDPYVRDGHRHTLLHVLHLLDHEPLLPRLLSAGLDLEARDADGRTPLYVAVDDGGSAALVRALAAAGARIEVVDRSGLSLRELISRRKRKDLDFLRRDLDFLRELVNLSSCGKGQEPTRQE